MPLKAIPLRAIQFAAPRFRKIGTDFRPMQW
jgi:hypothetical protein